MAPRKRAGRRKGGKAERAFGVLLRRLRHQKGLSQEALADASGYDRTYISSLERGVYGPTLKTLFDLAGCLGVKPAEIVRQLQDG